MSRALRQRVDAEIRQGEEKVLEGARREASEAAASASGRRASSSPLKGSDGRSPSAVGRRKRKVTSMIRRQNGATETTVTYFDRSINLVKFSADATVYTLARSWMKNSNTDTHRTPSPEPQEAEFELPRPTSPTPPPLSVPPTPSFDAARFDAAVAPQTANHDALLRDNVLHWRDCDKIWLEDSRRRAERFRASINVLRSRADEAVRQLQQQQPSLFFTP